ncbi:MULTISPECIES: septum site-determining protein MinC [Fusobacterium]|uniref:septum site-determining protein MinC n=1 Tax=Fusobacterium TaxID=848 RepID=UPI0004502029|nr:MULTISPECIES: septum site-determining protein MinC [Fusobacterium]EUB37071.1 septum formation inhibitor MinC, C-terminal domain protein [Fusobacterium sp. OBRC1]WRL73926.1 septum site-determining protein MinC [Fusobacterium polymorphum]
MSNHVIIKGKNDRLVIALNPDIDFLDICDILKTKILEAKSFIGNSRMAIEFSGRALTNEEENKLIGIITDNSNIVISYIFSKRTDSEEEIDLENINPLIEEGKTHFFRGTLRSGSKIESDGNIVVLGDVNPSSIIKARGNVIVLGHLNGTVYAGLGGDDRAFIAAIYFNPIQLTIGMKTITDIQDEILDSSRVNKKSRFKVARIRNQEIVVEELI